MPFQQSVNTYPAAGVTGQQAGLNPIAMLLPVPTAGEGGVTVGNAVWVDPDAPSTVIMETAQVASAYPPPVGIVLRDMASTIPCTDEATMQIAEGRPVAVAVRGDLLIAAPAAATGPRTSRTVRRPLAFQVLRMLFQYHRSRLGPAWTAASWTMASS